MVRAFVYDAEKRLGLLFDFFLFFFFSFINLARGCVCGRLCWQEEGYYWNLKTHQLLVFKPP